MRGRFVFEEVDTTGIHGREIGLAVDFLQEEPFEKTAGIVVDGEPETQELFLFFFGRKSAPPFNFKNKGYSVKPYTYSEK